MTPVPTATIVKMFRSLHRPGDPLVLVNCWDAGSATAVAAAGAAAVATSSWAVAAAAGLDDGELIGLGATLAIARQTANAVDIPVSVDLERGYAAGLDELRAVITDVVATGVAGINLEDGLAEGLRDAGEQAARIEAVRDSALGGLFINARTDVFLTSDPADHAGLLADGLDRLRRYVDAGADGVFVPGLLEPALVRQVVDEISRPVNVMVSRSEQAAELANVGVARVSLGPTAYLQAREALTASARSWLSIAR